MRDYTNPFYLLIPWLNAIFKKYMGTFFNEEIKKEQFTSMGLKKLTLKVNSFNQLLPPNMPFVLDSGSISLLKLDLQKLTCFIEEVEITLGFKTIEQYQQFVQTYQKQQINAAKLQKIKEDIIKAIKVKNEKSNGNQNAWNILRSFLQKITFTVNKLAIHVIEPQSKNKLSIAINQISLRVRKLQEEKDQMVSTAVIGGCSLHINENEKLFDAKNFQRDSCIFSLQQTFQEKYDQHVVIHIKTELKERLKFNSTLSIKLMQLCFSFQQFKIATQILLSILDQNKFIQSQDKVVIEQVKQEIPNYQFTWCQSYVTTDYWDKVDQKIEDDQSVSDGTSIEFNDEQLQEALEQSQFNEEDSNQFLESQIDETMNQSTLCQSNIVDLNQSALKQSFFSMSVFKELINDDDDKQGLVDLDDPTLIFKLKVQKIKIKLSKGQLQQKWNIDTMHQSEYYLLDLEQLSWLMTKELTSPTTIKQTKIEIPTIIVNHFQYCTFQQQQNQQLTQDNQDEDQGQEEELFQSVNEDFDPKNTQDSQNLVFQSCYNLSTDDVIQTIIQKKDEFKSKYGNNFFKQKTILQLYSESKQECEIITQVQNKFIFQQGKVLPSSIGLQIKIDHLNNTQAITINKLDLTLDIDEIKTFIELFKIDFEKRQIKSASNLNLVTIHHINIDIAILEPDYIDFFFINLIHKKEPNSSSAPQVQQKISFFTVHMTEFQLQQSSSGMLTYDQLFCYKKEYDRYRASFNSEVLAEIGASKHGNLVRPLIKIMETKEIRIAIPLVEFHLNMTYIEYVKSLIVVLKRLQQGLEGNKQEKKVVGEKNVKIIIDELIAKINLEIHPNQLQTRFIFHISKLVGEIIDENMALSLYNLCIVDTAWHAKKAKTDIPIYGSPKEYKIDQPQQILHFRHTKYLANQVVVYKQERFNREGFKTLLLDEAIKSDAGMGFQYTAIKLKMAKYLNPDCLDTLRSSSNIVELAMNKEKKIDIKFRHAIIQIDDQWEETIVTMIDVAKKWEQQLLPQHLGGKETKQDLNYTLSIQNLWMNYLPTYKRSTILKSYLAKKEPIKSLIAIQAEQLFYSWIRILFRIKEATISSDLQAHVRSASIHVKSTSKDVKDANLSFLNPILLIPPQTGLYDVDRKVSDGFQIDKDEQGLLRLLCFQKLFKLKGITLSGKRLNIGKIQGNLKKDSIISLWDIAQMTLEKIKKIQRQFNTEPETKMIQTGKLHSSETPINIFEDDDIELPVEERNYNSKQFEVILQDMEIKITSGQHFPPEIFSDSNPMKTFFSDQNQETYFLEHSNLVNLEEFPQYGIEIDYMFIIMKELKLICYGPTPKQINELVATILIFTVVDEVQDSKFSKLIGSEPSKHPQNFAELYYKFDKQNNIIDVDLKLSPIRICLSGATLEFLLQVANSSEQVSPKLDLLSNISLGNDKESIIEFCVQEGYQVSFERPSDISNTIIKFLEKPIQVDFLNIERIIVLITFDGNGVKLDGKLKGLVKMASYDNLVIYLKRAQIKNLVFEREADLIRLLYEQYEHLLKNDAKLISSLIISFKALQNITNIVLGYQQLQFYTRVQTMFVTIYKQGLFTGICSGSIPLVKALGNEIAYLAMKPIEVYGTVTEGIGLRVATQVFSPIERILDRFSILVMIIHNNRLPVIKSQNNS